MGTLRAPQESWRKARYPQQLVGGQLVRPCHSQVVYGVCHARSYGQQGQEVLWSMLQRPQLHRKHLFIAEVALLEAEWAARPSLHVFT